MNNSSNGLHDSSDTGIFEGDNDAGFSELQQAVASGDANAVVDLLKRGAEVNRIVITSDGHLSCALLTAVTLKDTMTRLGMVQVLLRAGADASLLSCRGRNVFLYYALMYADRDPALVDLTRLLISHGARPDHDLLKIAHSRSLFNMEYLLRRHDASHAPVETDGRNINGCVLFVAVIGVIIGAIVFYVSQYMR